MISGSMSVTQNSLIKLLQQSNGGAMTGNFMGGGSNSGLDSITLYEHNHLVDCTGMKFKPK